MKKHIPNTITMLNLFSGCIAAYLGFQGSYDWALFMILLAGIFDFLDGFAARLLNAYSPMGKELDSLADVISFGFAPGAIVFSVLSKADIHHYFAFLAFLIPIFSALRLAKFNLDTRQTTSFLGLPVPANAIFWAGLIYSYSNFFTINPWLLLALVLLFSLMLVSELPMFSLKMEGLSWKRSNIQYTFLIGCIALLAVLQLDAFAAIIVWYIVFSVGLTIFRKKTI